MTRCVGFGTMDSWIDRGLEREGLGVGNVVGSLGLILGEVLVSLAMHLGHQWQPLQRDGWGCGLQGKYLILIVK